jgi:glutamyl-tRNA synthetase
MAITHVVRGDDHISNTPKHVLLFQALGRPVPAFAHVPLILGTDKKRLSKRHGATSVTEYARMGYLPEAMVNFLALLGWSPGGDRELLSHDELTASFALEGISGGNAVFNPDKLDWMNQQYIMRLGTDELGRRLEPYLREAGLWREDFSGARNPWYLAVVDLFKPRLARLTKFAEEAAPFLTPGVVIEEAAAKKYLKPELAAPLRELRAAFDALDPFDKTTTEQTLRGVAERHSLKPAALIHATRVAVTGRAASPGLFEVLELLGRVATVERIDAALDAVLHLT